MIVEWLISYHNYSNIYQILVYNLKFFFRYYNQAWLQQQVLEP